jgi:uncharacterized protein YkwD
MATQPAWRFCGKCSVLLYDGDGVGAKGRCPASGGHEPYGFNFDLTFTPEKPGGAEPPNIQYYWRFCSKCSAMFYQGPGETIPPPGRCLPDGGHTFQGFYFALPHSVPERPWAQFQWRFCDKCHALFYQGGTAGEKGRCAGGNGHEAQGLDSFLLAHQGFTSDEDTGERGGVLKEINQQRTSQGAPPLRVDPRLDAIAEAHSRDLADHPGLWQEGTAGAQGHVGSDGSTPGQRIEMAIGTGGSENVYVGFSPQAADSAVTWWMNSPHHRENLLDPAHTATGIGYALGTDTSGATYCYYTQVFANE